MTMKIEPMNIIFAITTLLFLASWLAEVEVEKGQVKRRRR